jgi:hypothetical protein
LSNWQFDLRPLKFMNRLNLFMCRWHVTYFWKALDESYNFASNLTLIRGVQKTLWVPKFSKIPISRISRFPSWESQVKITFGWRPHGQAQRILQGGEGGDFPQVQAVVSFMNLCLSVARSCSNYTLTNLFGLCRYVWIINLLSLFLIPISELQHTPLPPKCYEPGNIPQFIILPLFSPFGLVIESMKELRVHQPKCHFVSKLQSWEFRNSQIETPTTLKAHNILCKLPIEVRFEVML